MKRYDELTPTQKTAAIDKCLAELLGVVCEGAIRFKDDSHTDLQAKIDAAREKAEQMQTPWFTHEYVMDTCAVELRGMAQCDAEDAAYDEPDDPRVISGIIQREAVPA